MSRAANIAGSDGAIGYDICLISMPYASITIPSLALGLLKSILTAAGLRVKVVNGNMLFAKRIGSQKFNLFAQGLSMTLMAGEWSFSTAAFPDIARDDDSYLQACADSVGLAALGYGGEDGPRRLKRDLLALRQQAELFTVELAQRVVSTGAKIVGCTSTFEQHTPSLALLRELKAQNPDIISLLGGANCEAAMGLATHRNFPWVDYIVSGEADAIIVELCQNILRLGPAVPLELLPKGVTGPEHRRLVVKPSGERIKYYDLDQSPIPDFSDYFSELKQLALEAYIKPGLPLETSRGCWWGALHHCTFCGLNGNGMGFRAKSAEKVLLEIEQLRQIYQIDSFEVVDNILDMNYFETLLPRLNDQANPVNLFYEIKANLSREKVRALKQSGINWVQPGIESLHSGMLELMDKGVKGWQNIQLLKWCREFGLHVTWSVLYNFPGEKDDWYAEMAKWVPFLEHLQPPTGLNPLRYDRFSVYHTQATQTGLDLQPFSAMRHVYGLPVSELAELSYFFTKSGDFDPFGLAGPVHSSVVHTPAFVAFKESLQNWRSNFRRGIPPILSLEEKGDSLIIFDSRACAKEFRTELKGAAKAILLACDKAPLSRGFIQSLLGNEPKHAFSTVEVLEAIGELKDAGYLIEIDGRYLNLAVTGDFPALPNLGNFPGGSFTAMLPAATKDQPTHDELVARDLVAKFSTALVLDSGKSLPEFELGYQTYGTLNKARSNALLVFHPFTKNAYLAGHYEAGEQELGPGWWDKLVGPGKALDTSQYYVVCSNVLGGSGGSTGPSSINPLTGAPYAMDFPLVTIGDMVAAQKRLMEYLTISQWAGIIGGCFGGEQALEWLARYPESIRKAVIVSATGATSAHTIALSYVLRSQICADPDWEQGNYYGKVFPIKGLTQAILTAVPIWMSRETMQDNFGRKRLVDDKSKFTFETDFEIEKFMQKMGANARKDFDPNSLLYLSRAAEYFDLKYYYGSLEGALEKVSSPVLFISYQSDWRYPPAEVDELHMALTKLGKESKHLIIDHPFGHGAFVFDPSGFATELADFLAENYQKS